MVLLDKKVVNNTYTIDFVHIHYTLSVNGKYSNNGKSIGNTDRLTFIFFN